jgi:iron complex transport system substrate-binding protein
LATAVVHETLRLYHDLGPGLLETVYERLLAHLLRERGLQVERQLPVDIHYRGLDLPAALRVDLLIERRLVVEVKAADQMPPVALRQTLTYLRVLHLPLGMVINFGGPNLSGAIRRVVNDHRDVTDSPLRLHAPPSPDAAP